MTCTAAIQLLDQIEITLRYIEGSDVWQINHRQEMPFSYTGKETVFALHQANEQTGGLFDHTGSTNRTPKMKQKVRSQN